MLISNWLMLVTANQRLGEHPLHRITCRYISPC